MPAEKKQRRGLASPKVSQERRREIAAMGGRASRGGGRPRAVPAKV